MSLIVLQAGAAIDPALQMQLGNPSGATANTNDHNHYLIQRSIEALDYNDSRGQANWASWDLTSADANGAVNRQDSFAQDTNLPANFYQVGANEYSGSGFDRGHLCPSADRTDSTNHNDLTFLMSNMMPQAPDNNRIIWANFENDCRSFADAGNEVLVICGPSGFGTNHLSSSTHVLIASNTWKIAVIAPLGSGLAVNRITATNRVIAIRVPNVNGVSANWSNYVTSANQIELETGFTFFTALPPEIASALRNKVDGQTSPPPAIFAFSPNSGGVNANVLITGTNFGSALKVTFNGAAAAFTVNSTSQITATVPTNATTGLIAVSTPSGTATSATSFTVNGPASVDLAVTVTHVGNFTQGDVADTCTILVTNTGALSSTGNVSVVDFLPSSLSATAITGTGWNTDLATLTCTRADSLAPGASYPPITVTFNLANNAPALVTNVAIAFGGGEAATNTASDVIAIHPSSSVGGNYSGTLAGWDMSGQSAYGISPLAPRTNAPNLTVTGLTRGTGIATTGSGAARGWGGIAFTNINLANAIATDQLVSFSATASAGYKVSYSSVSRLDYRRSGTGPPNGVLQFQVGNGAFTDIASLPYTSTSSSGASIGAIGLSGIAALQNVDAGITVNFRIVNYGGASTGTWYIFDTANSTALDFAIQGTLTAVSIITNPPADPPTFTLLAPTNNQFHFIVNGTAGSNYVLQAATDLSAPNWITLMTNAAPFEYVETNTSGFSQRFYRALVKP